MPLLAANPLIAVVMGDAAGIGPEITLRAVRDVHLAGGADFVVLGSLEAMSCAGDALGEHEACTVVASVGRDSAESTGVPVLDCEVKPNPHARWGVRMPSTAPMPSRRSRKP